MRARLILLATVVLLAAGCAPGSNDELRGLVDDVRPANGEMLECNWGTNWGAESGSYYNCFYIVPGKVDKVGRDVLDRIAALGFTVTCRTDAHTVELIGARGGTMFYADVLGNGFVHGRNVDESDVDLPPGSVLVELAAFEDDAGIQPGRLCALARSFTD
jgi:hypothetical protein